MSVKKMGSKLAQGVRQVQSQQVKTQPPAADTSEPVAPAVTAPTKEAGSAAKPAPQQAVAGGERFPAPSFDDSKLHPRRIWPD
ncbi:hypothetical protein [Acidithiobacillus sulfuriphilus]|uniref:Uncharacterized protein n=2 Tax=Acidithiobacillus sulfuriphilus TaxID=1867749 RepID=A0A3M8RNC8_9PROT|nr:hypothetical protein [Acidithiobacillus sulfuriphilus]RNF69843.1 hypothetical protein EC580_02160 [Acidithiobacillus sulfuriphilus]